MSKPCSQLNSKVIRDKVESHVIAAIEKTCSVLAFKCVWRVDDQEIERAWKWICEKRDECDLTLSQLSEICFFFSAISTSKLNSKRKKSERSQEDRESDGSNDETSINASQVSSPGQQVFPAMSYWLACQTHNGSAVNPFKIQRALGSSGVEFYLSKTSRKKGCHGLNQLCQVLKDHKNPCLMNLVESSYQHCFRALQEEIDVSDHEESQEMTPTENVVRVRVLHEAFRPMMSVSILELRRAGLQIDCFGLQSNDQSSANTELSATPHKPLSCPITILCNDIQVAMRKLQYGIYRGEIFKKVADAQFTFQFLCSMKSFLHNLMGNEAFKDRLVQHIQRLLPILSEPESSLISQLKINRDLVEVKDGWFWSFSAGSFVQGVIPESQKGLTSPRAYVDYDCSKDPNPRYFEATLRNSLSEDKIRQFCIDFLALFRKKEHKQPVPCAIGASDSGKTSLFSPVFQIVPIKHIARVTKQKSFNKAMIDSSTEVIFLDEAYSGLLDVDDWKILCQGGFTSHDVKWKKAQGFYCCASMYITCQKEMNFGEAHNGAMDRRLNKYYFKSLPSVEPEANKWLREHAMDCIVWAQKVAGTQSSSSTVIVPVVGEEGLPAEEIRNILGVCLLDENIPGTNQPDGSRERGSDVTVLSSESCEDSSSDGEQLEILNREVKKATSEGIRHRQLSMMLNNCKKRKQDKRRLSKIIRDDRLAHRRKVLVELGVVNESDSRQLISDPDAPLNPSLERKQKEAMVERRERLEAQRKRENEEKTRRAFQNPWLLNMEEEMSEHSRRVEQTTDTEERAVLQSLLEINSSKLRSFHEGQGTLALKVAVEERKKLCLERGWVEPAVVDCIRDVFSPLSVIVHVAKLSRGNNSSQQEPSCSHLFTPSGSDENGDDDDDDEIFLTPKTPSYVAQYEVQPACPPSPAMMCTPRKRSLLQSQPTPKRQKKLTSFFSVTEIIINSCEK